MKKRRLAQTQVIMRVPRNSLANPRRTRSAPELKFIDVAGSLGVINGTQWSELDFLNPIQTGATASERIGRRLQLKSVLFRWNGASLSNGFAFRVLIVYDREPNGAIPLITDVLEANNFNSPMNLSNANRFVILADELHGNEGYSYVGSITSSAGLYRCGKIYKKINLPCGFNALSTLDITSITQGAVFALVGVPANVTTTVGLGYFSRVRYTDV